jgi:serine/threonine protein phosphatase PrpC
MEQDESRVPALPYGTISKTPAGGSGSGAALLRDFSSRQVRPYLSFMAVAGGFGGPGAGDLAARMTVDIADHELDSGVFEGPEEFRADAERVLRDTFDRINARIDEAAASPGRQGIGATLTCAIADGERAFIAHAGNARAYLLTARGLRQVTGDHVEYLDGTRTRLTRALGIDEQVETDILNVPLKPSEVLFICSHGIYSALGDSEMAQLLSGEDLQHSCEILAATAIQRGASGDVSAVAWRVPGHPDGPQQAFTAGEQSGASAPRRRRRRWLVALIAVLVLAAAAAAGFLAVSIWLKEKPASKTGTSAAAPAARFAAGDVVEVDTTGRTDACYLVDYPGGRELARLYDGWKMRVVSTRTAGGERWYRVEVMEGQPAGQEGYVADPFLVQAR